MMWNWMKNYIQEHFQENMGYDALRVAVLEVWQAVPESYLRELSQSMHKRCQAVIDANGMYTKY